MTTEQMRIAVLESMGWKQKEHFEPSFRDPSKQVSAGMRWFDPNGFPYRALPPLTLDLMHEVENSQGELYWKTLLDVCDKRGWLALIRNDPVRAVVLVGKATALQRAEAYLKTIGQWKEQE